MRETRRHRKMRWVACVTKEAAQPPVSVVARVNSDCADWGMSNANEFTHGTHDRNLNPATPVVILCRSVRKIGSRVFTCQPSCAWSRILFASNIFATIGLSQFALAICISMVSDGEDAWLEQTCRETLEKAGVWP